MFGSVFSNVRKLSDPDREVRRGAIESLSSGDDRELLIECALSDPDPKLRELAGNKLEQLGDLEKIAAGETDPNIQKQLRDRIERLLFARAMSGGEKPDVRADALDKLPGGEKLRALGCELDDPDLLDRLLRRLDKREDILHIALDRNDETAGDLLLNHDPSEDELDSLARFAHSEPLRRRAAALLEHRREEASRNEEAPNARDIWRDTLRKLDGLCGRLNALAGRDDPESTGLADQLKCEYRNTPPPPPEYQEILDKKFAAACDAFDRGREEAARRRRERGEKVAVLNDLLTQFIRIEHHEKLLPLASQVAALEKKWRETAAGVPDLELLEQSFVQVHARLSERIAAERAAREEAASQIELLTRQLREGEKLQDGTAAGNLRKQVAEAFSLLGEAVNDPELGRAVKAYRDALKSFNSKLARNFETRDLARWENYTVKTAICGELAKLAETPDAQLPGVATHVRLLRERYWKTGSVPREKYDELNKRFRAVNDPLMERINRRFRQLDAERAEARVRKEAICEEADALANSTELNETTAKLKNLQAEWHALPRLAKIDEEALYRRFRSSCDLFFTARQDYFDRRKARFDAAAEAKNALCGELETIVSEPYAPERIAQCVALRRKFRELGRAGRDDEALENRFNNAFSRFEAARREAEKAECERFAERVNELEQIAAGTADGAALPESAYSRIRELANPPVPFGAGDALVRRFDAARDALRAAADRRERDRREAGLEALFAAERLCSEMLALLGTPAEMSRLYAEQSPRLAPLPGALIETLRRAAQGDQRCERKLRTVMRTNGEERLRICLELEKLGSGPRNDPAAALAEELAAAIAGNFGRAAGRATPEELYAAFLNAFPIAEEKLAGLQNRFALAWKKLS